MIAIFLIVCLLVSFIAAMMGKIPLWVPILFLILIVLLTMTGQVSYKF